MATYQDPSIADQIGGPAAVAQGLADAAQAFADTFWVAWALVVLTMVPALMLPRRREATHLLDDDGVPPVVVH
jgi:hypothetical protein